MNGKVWTIASIGLGAGLGFGITFGAMFGNVG